MNVKKPPTNKDLLKEIDDFRTIFIDDMNGLKEWSHDLKETIENTNDNNVAIMLLLRDIMAKVTENEEEEKIKKSGVYI